MKNCYLFFALFLLFTSCKTYKISNPKLGSIGDFEVTLEKVRRASGQSQWGRTAIVPPRGHHFFFLNLNIVNNSDVEKTIDMTDFALVDTERRIAYPLVDVYKVSVVVLPAKSVKKIKPRASLRRSLMFSFPKKKKPEQLLYKEEWIELDIY